MTADTQNPGGWPDAARPGVPANPERDGWHWIIGWNRTPFVAQWVPDTKQFVGGGIYEWRDGEDVAQGVVALGWDYGGPCLTPAEVAALTAQRDDWVEQARKAMDDAEAREAAARREGIEAAAKEVDCGCDIRDAVLARLEAQGQKRASWLCQHGDVCCALQAAEIRTLKWEGGR